MLFSVGEFERCRTRALDGEIGALRDLRRAREVIGHDADGDVGHVADLLIDDVSWAIRFLVVDTRSWLPGRQVLIGPDRLRWVDWAGRQIGLDLSRRQVETSPDYEPALTARA